MDQQVMLLATQAADEMDRLDAGVALTTALRQKFGTQMDDPRFVEGLLVGEMVGGFRRKLRASAMDPEQNEIPGQESMFPQPQWVVYTSDEGDEVWAKGGVATVEQVLNHYGKSQREHRATARRAEQGREKVQAMAAYLAEHQIDPSQMLWSEAVARYSRPVLKSMRPDPVALASA